jgi:hypothetical protein
VGGEVNTESVFAGETASVWQDEQVLELVLEMAAQQCQRPRCHTIIHLKTITVYNLLCIFCHDKKKRKKSSGDFSNLKPL